MKTSKSEKSAKLTDPKYLAGIKPSEAAKFIKQFAKPHVPDPFVVFDCGGLSGNQSIEFAKAYPTADVYCFEAHPRHAHACRLNTKGYKSIQVVEGALSDKHGETATFWKTTGHNAGGSSMHKFTKFMDSKKPFNQQPIDVNTLTLDQWAEDNNVPGVDIMWIDLQGHEGPMLAGAEKMLASVQIVHIESFLVPMYNGQTMFDEIAWRLRNAGLTMKHWYNHKCLVQCGDAVFVRA